MRGRKDVGGIVGQMEPFLTLRYEEDTVQALERQIDARCQIWQTPSRTRRTGRWTGRRRISTASGTVWMNLDMRPAASGIITEDQFKEWREDMDPVLTILEDILDGIDLDPDSSLNRDVKQLKSDIRRARKLMDTLREDPAQPGGQRASQLRGEPSAPFISRRKGRG